MPKIYIGGVSGSGKNSVGRLISQKDASIVSVSSSDLLMKDLGITDKADFKKIPNDELERARREVLPDFLNKHENVIMDGHFNLTRQLVDLVDAYVLIEVTPEKLLNYRNSDLERNDRDKSEDSIREDLLKYEQKVRDQEQKWGIKVIRIPNDSSLEVLADRILDVYHQSETKTEIEESEKLRI